jgi:hypothetical protein
VSKNLRLLQKYCEQKSEDFQNQAAMEEKPLTTVVAQYSDTRYEGSAAENCSIALPSDP